MNAAGTASDPNIKTATISDVIDMLMCCNGFISVFLMQRPAKKHDQSKVHRRLSYSRCSRVIVYAGVE